MAGFVPTMLDVYLARDRVATLEQASPARIRLRYAADAVQAGRPPLSFSLPARIEAYEHEEAAPFFFGLLPEGAPLRAITRELGVSHGNLYSTLEQIGRDCGGAVAILPAGEPLPPDEVVVHRLTSAGLAEHIANLPARPLGIDIDGEVRLSLAGAQAKLVLARDADGELGLPLRGTPSTVILKPEIGDPGLDDTTVNEAFCLDVCRGAGLRTADVDLIEVDGGRALVVERYDRIVGPGALARRLHQEDCCQALGILPEAKYESEGGPGVADVVGLIRRATRPSAPNVLRFLDQLVARYLLGDHDGHGKNVSILYEASGPILAPLYDVVSTAAYPGLTKKLAMRIGNEYRGEYVEERHWDRLATHLDLGVPGFRARRRRLASVLVDAARSRREDFRAAGHHRPVIDRIIEIVDRRAARV